jgi:Cysteine-rich secretory protein family
MYRITISLIFLIVISMVLPTSAIMYASGQTDDNSGSSSAGGGSTTTTTTDNSGSSSAGGGSTTTTTDNSGSSTGGSAGKSATLPTTSTASNNTGNAYCDACNNDIYKGGGDLKSIVLAVHNRERAAVGVPPLVWNDTLAADARTYAQYLVQTGKFEHPSAEWVAAHPMSPESENLAGRHGSFPPTVPIAQEMQGWIAEKNVFQGLPSATGDNTVGHYTQMIWKSTTQVGCATATANNYDVLVCRYTPPGNVIGQNPY